MMTKRKDLRELVHEAVEKGADSAEEIHKSIASLPLRILEDVGLMPEMAKEFGRIQDRSIGAVYDLIRQINDQVERVASDVLQEVGRRKPD